MHLLAARLLHLEIQINLIFYVVMCNKPCLWGYRQTVETVRHLPLPLRSVRSGQLMAMIKANIATMCMGGLADQCQAWNTVQDAVAYNTLRGHGSQRRNCCRYNHVASIMSLARWEGEAPRVLEARSDFLFA